MVGDRWEKYFSYVRSTVCITFNGDFITGSVPVGVVKDKLKYVTITARAKEMDTERLIYSLVEKMPHYWKRIGGDQ